MKGGGAGSQVSGVAPPLPVSGFRPTERRWHVTGPSGPVVRRGRREPDYRCRGGRGKRALMGSHSESGYRPSALRVHRCKSGHPNKELLLQLLPARGSRGTGRRVSTGLRLVVRVRLFGYAGGQRGGDYLRGAASRIPER